MNVPCITPIIAVITAAMDTAMDFTEEARSY